MKNPPLLVWDFPLKQGRMHSPVMSNHEPYLYSLGLMPNCFLKATEK